MRNIIIVASSRSGHNFVKNMIEAWCPDDEVWRFEGVLPGNFFKGMGMRIEMAKKIDISKPYVSVFVVRDFLNWFASMMKYKVNRGIPENAEQINLLIQNWFEIAKEAFNDTMMVDNKNLLIYDEFVKNEELRRQICSNLNGSYTEVMIDEVPQAGNYSSFDNDSYRGNGSKMDVCNRWEWFLTEEGNVFRKYISSNREIVEYYLDHFDVNDEKKSIINL